MRSSGDGAANVPTGWPVRMRWNNGLVSKLRSIARSSGGKRASTRAVVLSHSVTLPAAPIASEL